MMVSLNSCIRSYDSFDIKDIFAYPTDNDVSAAMIGAIVGVILVLVIIVIIVVVVIM